MKRYNLLTEDTLKSKTHWSKSGQYNAIEQIVKKYPSPAAFKKAVMASGDKKSIKLIQALDDKAPRNDYIDFLQNVFTKYSSTGKHLLSGLAGVGIGAAAAYAAGKIADSDYVAKGEGENIHIADPNSKFGKLLTKTGEIGFREQGRLGDALYKINPKIGNKEFVNNLADRLYGAGPSNLESPEGPIIGKQVLGAKILGGAAGMGAGTLGAHGIQSWRQKKYQDKINALKNS